MERTNLKSCIIHNHEKPCGLTISSFFHGPEGYKAETATLVGDGLCFAINAQLLRG